MASATTTSNMQQLFEVFANDLHKNFDEVHQQLINMNTHLHATEQAHARGEPTLPAQKARLERKDAINNLEAEATRVMITAGRALLNNKMEEAHSSSTPKIVKEVSNKLFTSRPTQQAPTAPPPWCPIVPSMTTQLQHQHPFEVRLTPPRTTARPVHYHGSPGWSFSSGCTTCPMTKKISMRLFI